MQGCGRLRPSPLRAKVQRRSISRLSLSFKLRGDGQFVRLAKSSGQQLRQVIPVSETNQLSITETQRRRVCSCVSSILTG